MPISTSSINTTAAVVITGVFSVAVAVISTVPSVSHFVASCFPIIYDNTVFLVKPPYLYVVINCIIVCIAATSKLTQKSSSIDDSDFLEVVTPVTVVPEPSDIDDISYLNMVNEASDYTGFVENDVPVDLTVEDVQRVDDGEYQKTETESSKPSIDSPLEPEKPKPSSDSPLEPEKPKPSSDSLMKPEKLKPSSDSPLEPEKPKPKHDSPETSILIHTRKPPRMSQQKSLNNSPKGGGTKTSALGVSKPPRQDDTLEATWKKIAEGRSTPLMKNLTKSDTWQERTHVQSSSSSAKYKKEKMTKSDNLNDINTPKEETQKTRLNREASPGQEELNQRVEAFIKKFNEDMRLQRLESLAKHNEMVNGGTRL